MFERAKCETPDLAKQNLEKLKALFPGVVTEGPDGVAIDVEALKQECSATPIEGNVERYEFTWPGKRAAKAAASTATNKTLRPCRAESVNFDTTENLYIEGDNLEVLKLLQTNYAGKVKMIYIDPPYNTGHDFVYRDRFSLTQKELESDAGAFDDDGNRFEVNDSSEARYHSNWCSMMYPRLKLARQLLRDDGVLFVSIDDNEIDNAKRLCAEVFGENNFRNTLFVRRRVKSLNSQFAEDGLATLNVGLEYVLVYAKSDLYIMNALRMKKVNAPTVGRWDVFWSNADRPTMRYDVLGFTPTTGQWRTSKEKADKAVANYIEYEKKFASKMTIEEYWKKTGVDDFIRRIPGGVGKNGGVQHWIPPTDTMLRTSNWQDIEVSEIGKEFDLPFDNPKNKLLLCELIKLASFGVKEYCVLDFFSGSATTAHAVMQLNAEDGGNRKFIMVQLPEPCAEDSEAAKAGYKNICEIGKERIRRAGKKISDELRAKSEELKKKAEKNGPNLFDEQSIEQSNNPNNRTIPDIGFRVLKLDSSSLEDASETASGTQQQMLGLSRIKEDRTSEDLLFQILLESKLSLSESIVRDEVEGNEVFFVGVDADARDARPYREAPLVACLGAKAKMTEKFFATLAKFQPALAFFRDDLFESDSARINLAQIFKQFSPNTTITVI